MLSTVKASLRRYVFGLDQDRFVEAFGFFNRLHWKLPVDLRWNAALGLYEVGEGALVLRFARKERVWVYAKGVEARLLALRRMYLVDKIPLDSSATVIDCGANIGEFSRSVRDLAQCAVIAIEPEPAEAKCIPANVPGVRAVINKALWKECGFVEFYSKNDTADSSVFEVEGFTGKTRVPTLTLDAALAELGIDRVRLLKLEAEGAEPEILAGADESLHRIEYITADLGPERGVRKETTLAPVANLLLARGFELVDVYKPRLICLFRNRKA
jgi:FkbM family methyltransferase